MEEVKTVTGDAAEERELVWDLAKPYSFEGKSYHKIDLTGLENLTAADMIAVNRLLSRNGNSDTMQEVSLEYACALASRGSGQPMEFYEGLPPKEAIRLKAKMTHFLFGSE